MIYRKTLSTVGEAPMFAIYYYNDALEQRKSHLVEARFDYDQRKILLRLDDVLFLAKKLHLESCGLIKTSFHAFDTGIIWFYVNFACGGPLAQKKVDETIGELVDLCRRSGF